MQRTVTALHSTKYVVTCITNQQSKKIFQIGFTRSDSSLYISLPYFNPCEGIVGIGTLTPEMTFPATFKVGEKFPATSHSVKYSHHPTGRAHFSLTGKVKSSVGRQSIPLNITNGHVFTVMVQGLDQFKDTVPGEDQKKDRRIIPYRSDRDDISALKFVGHIWPEIELARRLLTSTAKSPWLRLVSKDGSVKQGILLSTPIHNNGHRSFIVMSLEHIPHISKDRDFMACLLGGFDDPKTGYDHSVETSFLLAMYPAPNADETFVRTTIDIAT